MPPEFILFAVVGFLAQLVDGALGMAYGVVSSTVLLSFGVPPAQASASVHAAELFTTAASGGSHILHRNIDWRWFWRLVPAGVVGGALGAFVLTSIDGAVLRPYVTAYLGLMGVVILVRAFRPKKEAPKSPGVAVLAPLGGAGAFLDAAGGGGWGPIVTSTLIGSGQAPRFAIGTVNAAEFLVTAAISATFVIALVTGHWQEAEGLASHAWAVGGLIVGGLLAAPIAGYLTKFAPIKPMTIAVGVLVIAVAIYQLGRLLHWF